MKIHVRVRVLVCVCARVCNNSWRHELTNIETLRVMVLGDEKAMPSSPVNLED
jgi:hypothetical protein